MPAYSLCVGTAGWNVPKHSQHRARVNGSHLERYASVLPCVEINSSFYRPHAFATYARWAASTPPSFRFAVKVPKTITHEQRLRRARLPLERFLAETAGLGRKRGPLLIQLPPSLSFDVRTASAFFRLFRALYDGPAVFEPRHPTWFDAKPDGLLLEHRIARVAADPFVVPAAGEPGGWDGLAYYRLHGSPRTYWSRYGEEYLRQLAHTIAAARCPNVWVVFDNTAEGWAFENACELLDFSAAP